MELRRAEAHHLDVKQLVSRGVAARGFEDAQDVAAVLCSRIAVGVGRDARAGRSRTSPQLIVGLIPKAIGLMTAEMRQALEERGALIEERARAVLDEALLAKATWTQELGVVPHRKWTPGWRQHACTVAAYRDRYGIVGASALGPVPQTVAQRRDAARARAALGAAQRLSEGIDAFAASRPGITTGPLHVHIQV